MKFAIFSVLILTVSAGQLVAGECGKSNDQSISLQGKVVHKQKEVLDKKGEIKTVEAFYLTTADADVELPVHKNCQGEVKVDLRPFIGQTVTVTARGSQKQSKDGKTLSYVNELVSVRSSQSGDIKSAFAAAKGSEQTTLACGCKGEATKSQFDSISLQGEIVFRKNQILSQSGEIKTVEKYFLTSTNSEIELPVQKNYSGEVKVDLKPFVGQTVTINARGIEKSNAQGKKLAYVHEVVSVGKQKKVSSANPFSSASRK